MTDLTPLSARRIAALVRRKSVSPVEVIQAHLRKVERLNFRLNAFGDIDVRLSTLELC